VHALFFYKFGDEGRRTLRFGTTMSLSENPLDIVPLPPSSTMSGNPGLVVSLGRDPSTAPPTETCGTLLLEIDTAGSWEQAPFKLQDDTLVDGEPDLTVDEMNALQYHTEILRKTHFEDNDEDDGPQDQEEVMAIDG